VAGGQGFCDVSTKVLVLKVVTIWGVGILNCGKLRNISKYNIII